MNQKASNNPRPTVVLVSIDNLNDFIREDGRLSVPNAIPAAINTATFIDKNLADIDHIIHIFDTHRQKHIFYAMWWVDKEGNHPNPYEDITCQKVLDGVWIPVYEKEWSVEYARKLGSFKIWPEHCTENSVGGELYPAIANATFNHSIFHKKNTVTKVVKGLFEKTENYGSFGPEVEDPNDPSTKLNVELIKFIANFDRSYWCGEEEGHCDRVTLEQYIGWCKVHSPESIAKMRYLKDCVSILEFGQEYKSEVAKAVQNMVDAGMVIVNSTDPIF